MWANQNLINPVFSLLSLLAFSTAYSQGSKKQPAFPNENQRYFENPVLGGDYPDPSIIDFPFN
jgi:hypothetical protein